MTFATKNQIKIRSVPSHVNPTPRPTTSSRESRVLARNEDLSNATTQNDFDDVLSNIIGEDFLRGLLGTDEFSDVRELKLSINTSTQSMDDLGDILRNLVSVDLEGSDIVSIRDLGTSFRNITTLSLNNCKLRELDGMGSFIALRTLSLRENYISDVCPLGLLENLRDIDLHGNNIMNLLFTEALCSCPSLLSLRLTANPITKAPKYEAVVASLISGLRYLDGMPVDEKERMRVSHTDVLDASYALRLAIEEQEEEARMETLIMEDESSSQRLKLQSRPVNAAEALSDTSSMLPDTGSDLTHGSAVVLVGGMAAALRQRRGRSAGEEEPSTLDLLDAVLRDKKSSTIPSQSNSVFQEGDVTQMELDRMLEQGVANPSRHLIRARTAPDSSMRKPLSNLGKLSNNFVSNDVVRPMTGAALARTTTSASTNWLSHPRPTTSANSSRKLSSSGGLSKGRPSTAANSAAAPSAPFKVTFAMPPKSSEDSCATTSSQSKEMSSKNTGKSVDGVGRGVSFVDTCDVSVQDEGKSKRRSSLVKRDIVFRSTLCSTGSDSEEDIAVTHQERLQMMASSGRAVISPEQDPLKSGMLKSMVAAAVTVSSLDDVRQNLTANSNFSMPTSGGYAGSDMEESDDENSRKHRSKSISASAGRSLGFDLRGSLAAIEQWVDDMDSASEHEVDRKDKEKCGALVGSHLESRGSDDEAEDILHMSSRATAVGVTAKEKEKGVQRRPGTATTSGNEILSREKIMSMCLGTTELDDEVEGAAVHTSLKPQIRARKHKKSTRNVKAPAQPDILVIDHDASYELDIGDVDNALGTPLHKKKKGKSDMARQVSRSISPTPHPQVPSNSSTGRSASEEIVHNDVNFCVIHPMESDAVNDHWDDYGDMEEALMLDFEIDRMVTRTDDVYADWDASRARKKSNKSDSSGRRRAGAELRLSPPKINTRGMKHAHHTSQRSGPKIRTKYGVPRTTHLQSMDGALSASTHPDDNRSSSFRSTDAFVSDDVSDEGLSRSSSRQSSKSVSAEGRRSSHKGEENVEGVRVGAAAFMSDTDLVTLLNKPPKTTKELRTKTNFQDFFRGISYDRMVTLLQMAYCELNDSERQVQVEKRLKLLKDVLVT